MSALVVPDKVFLFASFLFRQDLLTKNNLQERWEEEFGVSVYFTSAFTPMKRYYSKEMGEEKNLERFFLVSTTPCEPDLLVKAKLWSVSLENEFLDVGKRTVNVDVGTISLGNLQLATGKNFTHRVYIGQGVYSDLTLVYQEGSYRPLQWTYPDYQEKEVITYFNGMRDLLHTMLKA